MDSEENQHKQEKLQRRCEQERQARAQETVEEREVKLQRRHERERQVGAEEREVRLQRRHEQERQARARETAEEREARLNSYQSSSQTDTISLAHARPKHVVHATSDN